MDDFISREAAYKTLTEYYHHSSGVQHTVLREALNRVPTADVRPVARAKWDVVEKPLEKATICECSECKNRIWMYDGDDGWNFCPNCGADMGEVKADG